MDTNDDTGECIKHPCAPHGFNRNGSHSEDRYVCDCEGWTPDRSCAGLELLEALKMARAELAGLPRSLGYDFTHLPKIDAVIARYSGRDD